MPSNGGSESGRDGSSDGRSGGGGLGGDSGGGLSAGRSGLGLRGNTGTASGVGSTGLGGAAMGSGADTGGLGLRGGSNIGAGLGDGARTSGTIARASVGAAIASAPASATKPTEKGFLGYLRDAVNVAGGLLGIASGSPLGVVGGIATLGEYAKGISFGETAKPSADSVSFGGNDGGKSSDGVGLAGVVSGGRLNIGVDNRAKNKARETSGNLDIAPLAGVTDNANAQRSGEVLNVTEPVIVNSAKTDYSPVIAAIATGALLLG